MPALTVVQLLPALEAGGVERSTLEIAAALVAAGHRARVVSAGGRLCGSLLALGAEHVELAIGRKSPLVLRHLPALRRQFAGADIVHARSRLPAWLAWLALRGMQERPHFVTTVHGLNSPGRYSAILARGERVICVSETVRQHLLHHYPSLDRARLRVIPRGIDPAEFARAGEAPARVRARRLAEFPELAEGPLLLLPGRGTRLKGHERAIALLAALRARGIEAGLLCPGAVQSGRERYLRELLARARTAGVADRLRFTPPRPDMDMLYAASDLVLQLSERPEAFGRTVLESLAVGRPALGWDHGGVGELLRELYPAGAVKAFDEAALCDAAERLLAAAPPCPVTIPYTLARMQAATLELYAELLRS